MDRVDDARRVGSRIRAARLQRGLSQRTLAGLAGLSQTYLCLLENGDRPLQRHDYLIALSEALSVSPAELLGQGMPHDPAPSGAHAAIPALRLALMGVPQMPTSPPDLTILAERTALSTRLYHDCEYGQLAQLLPGLLGALTAASETATGDRHRELLRLQARVYHPACVLLCKVLGYTDLAWIAVDRAAAVAAELGYGLGEAVSGFYKTHVLIAAGALDAALETARVAEQQVAVQLHGPEAFALYGELHLISATTLSTRPTDAAVASEVDAHLTAAAEAAERTGETHAHGLNFGPTNVGIHRVSTAVNLGQFGQAVRHAEAVRPFEINAPGRQAAYYSDLARALAHHRGMENDAVMALLRAETIAPQRIHANALLTETVGALAGRRLPEPTAQLVRKLATRVGLS
jgi:transcriptional regulator with XRE-family HTH domain